MIFRPLVASMAVALLCGCATRGVVVYPMAETVAVGTANEDAADDPAIWVAAAPTPVAGVMSDGFIAGTDKKAGLYIYGFDGTVLQFLPDGLLNNVDVSSVEIGDRPYVLIGASDRTEGRMGIALFRFDVREGGQVERWGQIPTDLEEPYGFCMRDVDGVAHAVVIGKDGQVRQIAITADASGQPVATELRRFAVGSISEGCAIDRIHKALFISEENVGVWRYGLEPASGDARTLVQGVDNRRLTADVEGETILDDFTTRSTYLIVSSQGDSGFAVWRVENGAQVPTWIGRFIVRSGPNGDAVTGTDGLDAQGGAFGPYPDGLVVVQDDVNEGGAQNFKLIDWRDVKAALGIE